MASSDLQADIFGIVSTSVIKSELAYNAFGNTEISDGSNEQMKSSHHHADMHKLLRNCLDEAGLELKTGGEQVFWCEQEL